jgi:hypothetical protein
MADEATLDDSTAVVTATVGREIVITLEYTASASKTIYSWAIQTGTLPTGLAFVNPNTIVGTPTVNGVEQITIRKSEVDSAGSTSYVDHNAQIVVLPGVVAVEDEVDDDFAMELDMAIVQKEITIPGQDGLITDEDGGVYLCKLFRNENFDLGVLPTKRGNSITLSSINEMPITFKVREVESPIALNDPTDVTISGNRIQTELFVDPDLFSSILGQGVQPDLLETYVDGMLQIEIAEEDDKEDSRDYEDSQATSTFTLDEGYSATHSLSFDLTGYYESGFASVPFDLEIRLTVPGDTGLNITFTRTLVTSDSTGVVVIDSEGGTATGSGSSTVAADWDTDIDITGNVSGAGSGYGIDVDVDLTTDAQVVNTIYQVDIQTTTSGGDPVIDGTTATTVDFRDSGSSSLYEFDASTQSTWTAAQVAADIETGLSLSSGILTVEIGEGADHMSVYNLPGSVAEAYSDGYASTTSATNQTDPNSPEYTNCIVSATLTGTEKSGVTYREKRFIAQAPVRIYRDH